jgi:uncharacterized protein
MARLATKNTKTVLATKTPKTLVATKVTKFTMVFLNSSLCGLRVLCGVFVFVFLAATAARAQELPELTAPINDFANVIDPSSEAAMDSLIRSLQQASSDVVVVATVKTFAPYADIREYAVKLFENHGRGIGQRGKDNGLLVVLAVDDRRVGIEVGYDLEEFITDGFAGETSRQYMAPEFRRGAYGAGLLAGVSRIIARIAERRNVTIQGVRPGPAARAPAVGSGGTLLLALFVLFIAINAIAARTRGNRRFRGRWGSSPAGWHSGVGPFGGGFGGFGGGGGGFGGGFGGFGGGRSGGGGGGASW